jgi:hypothetical protein
MTPHTRYSIHPVTVGTRTEYHAMAYRHGEAVTGEHKRETAVMALLDCLRAVAEMDERALARMAKENGR